MTHRKGWTGGSWAIIGAVALAAILTGASAEVRAEGAAAGVPGLYGDVNEVAGLGELAIKNPVRPLGPSDGPLTPTSVTGCGNMGGAIVPMGLMMFAGLKAMSARRRRFCG
ncbi:MAG: hypothetical protein IT449_13155 [Phycisphaerales bacterium]|nr:hypothetical protein [Phycisphaerales bacterium]